VVGEFSESVTKITCPILVIQSDNLRGARDSFDQAIELKNEMPSQVRLAIVPSLSPGAGVPPAMLRALIIEFANSLAPVAVGAPR